MRFPIKLHYCENKVKKLLWTTMFCFIFVEKKNDTFKNATQIEAQVVGGRSQYLGQNVLP